MEIKSNKTPLGFPINTKRPFYHGMRCDKCSGRAVEYVKYSGMHLCSRHFIEFVEKRVKKDLRRQFNIKGARLAVAMSGGKDSTLALHLIHKIYGKHRNVEIIAITVNEGIGNYRDEGIKIAQKNCKMRNIEHIVVSFKERYGVTVDEIAAGERKYGVCTYCGVLRRKLLNIAAKEIGADYLILGTNLDDYSQSILMNFVRGDLEKLARLGPHRKRMEGFVPRIFPLRTIPERENYLYALLTGIEFLDAECPYAKYAHRGIYKDIVYNLEYNTPGTRHSLLKAYEIIQPYLEEKFRGIKMNRCTVCGEPTPNIVCKACVLLQEVKGVG